MQVAVLGGGLQGCCVAMALAERGVRVTLFERNPELLTQAAVTNEGKIHLGYMYAGDPTLNTAGMMIRGALSFAPFLSAHLGVSVESFPVADPAVYVVHRDSQKSPDEIRTYIDAVHSLVQEAAASHRGAYFGSDLTAPIQAWPASDLERELNTGEVCAAFQSPEVAIDPVALARLIRRRIEQTPEIELRFGHTVTSVREENGLEVVSRFSGETLSERFDHVINALWGGRLAIDASLGLRPQRPWIHRLKYGVSFRPPPAAPRMKSITVVLGPFGEVVTYASGQVYLTWYPDCLQAISHDLEPPRWPTSPDQPVCLSILRGTFHALSAIVPALGTCKLDELQDVTEAAELGRKRHLARAAATRAVLLLLAARRLLRSRLSEHPHRLRERASGSVERLLRHAGLRNPRPPHPAPFGHRLRVAARA